jgi:integrase
MSLYRRGRVWYYSFKFQGSRITESTGVTNKATARDAETNRKSDLKNGRAQVKRPVKSPLFAAAAENWLKAKRAEWANKNYIIESTNVAHLAPAFGKRLLRDISASDVVEYRDNRLLAGASPKTASLEVGALRALLRYHDLDSTWCAIAKKVKLAKAEKVGRCISTAEESALLAGCSSSRSGGLYVGVVVALQAGMRVSEIRLLRWRNVDLVRRTITVGKSKTDAGAGRCIPMNRSLHSTLDTWASRFPLRKLDNYVFPSEKVGHNGGTYALDVSKPIGSWKVGWKEAKKRAGVTVRYHDLRHSCITRWLDAGIDHAIVAEMAGWSTSTAIRMIREVYGHVGLDTRKRAIEQAETFMQAQKDSADECLQKSLQSEGCPDVTVQ